MQKVIAQTATQARLRRMVEGDRMAHALLFLGPEGCGKLALSIDFAQYVLCPNKTTEAACGKCPSCIKAGKLIHPDLHFSYPTVGSKVTSDSFAAEWRAAIEQNPYLDVNEWLQRIGAENKQGNINKDECLNIIRKLSLKSFEGGHKILVIWLPEYLGKEGNRLLKLIEEPPENTLFILVAEQSEKILNTILSRCQLVKIPALQDDEVVEGLIEKLTISTEKANTAAHLANGNFNEALKLAEQNESDHAALFLDWFRKCWQGNGVELVNWTNTFAKYGRENQKHFLQYALHFLRELLLLRVGGNMTIRLQEKELTTATKMAQVIDFQQVEKISNLLNDCSYYVERNANPKILFLDASLKMHGIMRRLENS